MGPAALAVLSGLACAACDDLIHLDSPILARPDAAPDDAAYGAGPDAAGSPGDAGVDAAPCAMAPCAGGCADLTTDGQNCGACGHSCLGGTCGAGRCLPEVLAVGSPASLAVDSTDVYWTDAVNRTVNRCPIAGCPDGGETLFVAPDGGAGGEISMGGIAVQSGRVFFAETDFGAGTDTLYSCPTTGCGGDGSALVAEWQSTAAPSDVVADANLVYWTGSASGGGNSVFACPVAGCAGNPSTIAADGLGFVGGWELAVGGGTVYLPEPQGGVEACSGSCICPEFGGTCTNTAGTPYDVSAIAVGASGVYWSETSVNEVFAYPLGPPDAGVPAPGVFWTAAAPGDLAVDADDVYFTTTQAGGAIERCAIGGCGANPTVVASGLGGLGSILVDAHRIYAVVGTPGAIGPGAIAPSGNAIIWIAK
jgi:hypothetical protein